ncbi:DUF2947 family protein [Marinomonas sp. TW1]|uniref:DUF2947 family protein n=1 Tax=Marinomonas sp. TW1 TaxID=1561203 RepID=UPI0007AEF1A7|nr:DUF2947 family protein [Marinomonas sp. TW1]KZN12653.1 hypothetical protein OA79_15400 [Marinomonas sp. TW1]
MYQALSLFSKSWIFKRQDPKVVPEDLAQIHFLVASKAEQIWRDYISQDQLHPDLFTEHDWPNKVPEGIEINKAHWEKVWDSEASELPEEVLAHCNHWGEDTIVYFCCHNEQVFELNWGVFKRTWKAFLFLDNGPILVGKKKKQALQFHSNGWVNLLMR